MDIEDMVCPTCGAFEGQQREIELPNGTKVICDCETQRRKSNHYKRFGIPKEYWYIGWEDFMGSPKFLEEVKDYTKDLDGAFKMNVGMFLFGTVGTGKTFSATQILKEAEAKGYYNCMFTYLSDIVSVFTAGWYGKENQESFERRIMEADFLVIDDLGKEFGSATLAENVFDKVIRRREKPLIITSNIPLEVIDPKKGSIGTKYGDGIKSLFGSKLIGVAVEQEKDYRWDKIKPILKERKAHPPKYRIIK